MNRRTVLTMVLAGLLGFAQAQNNSNDTRKAPQAANPTEQRGPSGPGGRQAPKTALESDCYSDAEKQLIREVAEKFEQRRSSRADSIHAELMNPAGKEVMVVAHWGDWHGTCENSLHAIQKAVEKGAKIATLQLQKTKDGQLVCFSDPTVERVTTGKGAVKDLTLAELRQLTVREYQGPAEWSTGTRSRCSGRWSAPSAT